MEKPPSIESKIDSLVTQAAQEIGAALIQDPEVKKIIALSPDGYERAKAGGVERGKRVVEVAISTARDLIRRRVERADDLNAHYEKRVAALDNSAQAQELLKVSKSHIQEMLQGDKEITLTTLQENLVAMGAAKETAAKIAEEVRTQGEKIVKIPTQKK